MFSGAGDDTVLGGPGQISSSPVVMVMIFLLLDRGMLRLMGEAVMTLSTEAPATTPWSVDRVKTHTIPAEVTRFMSSTWAMDKSFINVVSGSATHLVFGPGISLNDLTNIRVDDSGISFGVGTNFDSFDSIFIVNAAGETPSATTATFADDTTVNLIDYYLASQVQADQILISTAPNQTLMGGAGNNTLIGGEGNSTLIAGSGNSTLIGGSGHTTFMSAAGSNALGNYVFIPGAGGNTYIIPPGAGRTVILPNSNVPLPGASNKVQFAAGYGNFKPTLSVGSLDIHFASGGELIIEGFDPNNAQRNPGIDTFEFTDRTFTYNQFLALGFDIQATGSSMKEVNGTSVTDRLVGTQGNDTLNGGAGNDTLIGGPGDVLVGRKRR